MRRELPEHDLVLVVDFGAQYAQLIARRVREAHVYSEIVPRSMPVAEMLARSPKAIILSGGPASVHVDGAPSIDPAIYDAGRAGARHLLRRAARRPRSRRRGREDRRAASTAAPMLARRSRRRCCSASQPAEQVVWMSHCDAMTAAPPGFVGRRVAPTRTPAAVIEDRDRGIYAVQFHPEVAHTERGQEILKAFLSTRAGCRPDVDERVDHRAGGRRDPRPGRRPSA